MLGLIYRYADSFHTTNFKSSVRWNKIKANYNMEINVS